MIPHVIYVLSERAFLRVFWNIIVKVLLTLENNNEK